MKSKSSKNNISKLIGSNVWLMCSDGIMADFDDMLDYMIETDKDVINDVKVISRGGDCNVIQVNKQWLINQLED